MIKTWHIVCASKLQTFCPSKEKLHNIANIDKYLVSIATI